MYLLTYLERGLKKLMLQLVDIAVEMLSVVVGDGGSKWV